MSWPLLMGGATLQAIGNQKANFDKGRAEWENAAFLREQAAFAQEQGDRKLKLHFRESQRQLGAQVSAFSAGGVDIGSGSALDFLAEERAFALEEAAAIQADTAMNVRIATVKANASDKLAAQYMDGTNNLLQGGAIMLGGASQGMQASG